MSAVCARQLTMALPRNLTKGLAALFATSDSSRKPRKGERSESEGAKRKANGSGPSGGVSVPACNSWAPQQGSIGRPPRITAAFTAFQTSVVR